MSNTTRTGLRECRARFVCKDFVPSNQHPPRSPSSQDPHRWTQTNSEEEEGKHKGDEEETHLVYFGGQAVGQLHSRSPPVGITWAPWQRFPIPTPSSSLPCHLHLHTNFVSLTQGPSTPPSPSNAHFWMLIFSPCSSRGAAYVHLNP